MNKKIIILDFSTTKVHVFPYDNNIYEDAEDFFIQSQENGWFDSNIQDCEYMIVDNLEITIH